MTRDVVADLAARIRDVQDFPIPGILFKDITPILQDADSFHDSIELLAALYDPASYDVIVGMESRGFVFGAAVAYKLHCGFVPVRKPGKLPAEKISVEYALEYGTNTLEMHGDGIVPGQRALLLDDLLATGGTCRAAIELVERLGGIVVGTAFLVELEFLHGRERIGNYPVKSVLRF
ncbi:MAG: adenine phosphoribosyltransferase [Chloroflexi bacterium]|jgi:adenine phosphoribosyltransferase|nr:adenine phosphoribosyltransferase [Chloroflexota bacterium]MDB5076420.1 adenine phosphoribosyltransferase [Chloroflexota bacterium]